MNGKREKKIGLLLLMSVILTIVTSNLGMIFAEEDDVKVSEKNNINSGIDESIVKEDFNEPIENITISSEEDKVDSVSEGNVGLITISELGNKSLDDEIKSLLISGNRNIEILIDQDYTPSKQIEVDLTGYEDVTLKFNGQDKSKTIHANSYLGYLFKIISTSDNNNIIFENLTVEGKEDITKTGMLDGENINLELSNFDLVKLENDTGSIFKLKDSFVEIKDNVNIKNNIVRDYIFEIKQNTKPIEFNISGDNVIFEGNSVGNVIYFNDNESLMNISGKNIEFINNNSNNSSMIFFAGKELNISSDNLIFNTNTGGDEGGALRISYGEVNVNKGNVSFIGNQSTKYGGAIYIDGGVKAEFNISGANTKVLFEGNKALSGGGAVYLQSVGSINITDGEIKFLSNGASSGGAINFNGPNSKIKVNNDSVKLEFIKNIAGNTGGAIKLDSKDNLQILQMDQLIFDNNKAATNGGAIYGLMSNGDNLNINNISTLKFLNNSSNESGGSIYIGREGMELSNIGILEFSNNSTGLIGGAIYAKSLDLNDINILKFTENSSNGNGGAIYTEAGGIKLDKIERIDFIDNTAEKNGGAIVSLGDLNVNNVKEILFVNNKINFVENNISTSPRTFKGGAIYTVGVMNFNDEDSNILFKNNNANLTSSNATDELMGGAVYTKGGYSFKGNIFFINNLKALSNDSKNEALDNNGIEILPNDNIKIKIKYKDGSDIETIEINNFEQGKMKDIKLSQELKKEIEKTSKLKFNTSGVNSDELYELSKSEFKLFTDYLEKDLYKNSIEKDLEILFKSNKNILNDSNKLENKTGYIYLDINKGEIIDPVIPVDPKPEPERPGPSIPEEEKYRFTFDGNGGLVEGKEKLVERVEKNKLVKEKNKVEREGFTFMGWSTKKDELEKFDFNTKISKDTLVYAIWSDNSTRHIEYIEGYEDKTIRPEDEITRAEVSAIIYRIMDDARRNKILSTDYKYIDQMYKWSREYIATLSNGGILEGYPDRTFRPNDNITRAEVAAMIARYNNVLEGENTFVDVKGHWAEKEIGAVLEKEWIEGYEDGSFRPDAAILRAELVTIINRMLDRGVTKDQIPTDKITEYSDLNEGKWYYEDMVEASNGHDFKKIKDIEKIRNNEKWLNIKALNLNMMK